MKKSARPGKKWTTFSLRLRLGSILNRSQNKDWKGWHDVIIITFIIINTMASTVRIKYRHIRFDGFLPEGPCSIIVYPLEGALVLFYFLLNLLLCTEKGLNHLCADTHSIHTTQSAWLIVMYLVTGQWILKMTLKLILRWENYKTLSL